MGSMRERETDEDEGGRGNGGWVGWVVVMVSL